MPRKPKRKGKTALGDNLYLIKGSYWFIFTYKGKTYRERIGRVGELPLTSAKHIASELKSRIIRGEYIPLKEENLTFKEIARKYLEWYRSSRPHLRKRTLREMERKIALLNSYFGRMEVVRISEWTIENYKSKRIKEGVKPSTVNNELSTLRAVLRKAKEWGLISKDPPKVRMFKVSDERVRFLSPEELRRLLDACPPYFRPLVEFAVLTGLRASELLSLRWENVNIEGEYIEITARTTKTKETRRIPLSPRAVEILKELKAKQKEKGIDHGYVFTNRMGKPYSVEGQGYKRVFKTACKKAGIEDFRFHDLRHTFASYLVMSGVDLYTVQELMRHKTPQMTKRYAHLSPEHMRKELKKVDDLLEEGSNF